MNRTGLAAAVFAFYLLLAPWTSLWDRDEPHFAQASVEMLRSGQYLYPTFGGEVRVQKPILIYWLMTMSVSILGVSEFSVRFWSSAGLALAAYATGSIGSRLFSPAVGLVAMAVVAFNPLAMVQGTLATADAVLLGLLTSAMAALVWRISAPNRIAPVIVFAVTVAGALLTRGPVGLLPPLVAAGVIIGRRRQPDARRLALEFGAATAVALALFAAWAVPANAATGGRFFSQGFMHDVVDRVLTPLQGHGGHPLLWLPYYPLVILIGFAPWSAYLLGALRARWRHDGPRTDADRVLIWWIAAPFVAFSLAATHLPHYILPMWPALALAVAGAIGSRPSRAFRHCLVAAIVFEALAGFWWAPALERFKPVPRIAALVQAQPLSPATELAAYGFAEPSLDFYLGRSPARLRTAQEVENWSSSALPGLLVTTRDALAQLSTPGVVSLHELGSSAGINIANGQRIELVALQRARR